MMLRTIRVCAAMMQGASSMETMVSSKEPMTMGKAPPNERRMPGVRTARITARIFGRKSSRKMKRR
jgi:hypothetical protein